MVTILKTLFPLLSLFVVSSLGQQCPSENDVLPCRCTPPSGSSRGFRLDCYYPTADNDLTNSRLTQILDNYLSAGITSLSSLNIYGASSLTALSPHLSRFSNLESIEIYYSGIRSIPSNSFNFAISGGNLQIRDNTQMTSIGAGAFQGRDTGVYNILMDRNSLTRLDENFFRPLVEPYSQDIEQYGIINVNNNPIDCVIDKCHLAWLIRDLPASNLAYRFVSGECSNGTSFSGLNPRAYQDCPTKLFTCPSPNGLFVNPDNPCGEVFYQCSAGYAYFQYCPSGLVFNPRVGYCDYRFNVPGC